MYGFVCDSANTNITYQVFISADGTLIDVIPANIWSSPLAGSCGTNLAHAFAVKLPENLRD
ncbi:MAG: hypothetical protein ACRETW_03455, partial [Stenotrophobium sp.]